jgi:hypothetical protein
MDTAGVGARDDRHVHLGEASLALYGRRFVFRQRTERGWQEFGDETYSKTKITFFCLFVPIHTIRLAGIPLSWRWRCATAFPFACYA